MALSVPAHYAKADELLAEIEATPALSSETETSLATRSGPGEQLSALLPSCLKGSASGAERMHALPNCTAQPSRVAGRRVARARPRASESRRKNCSSSPGYGSAACRTGRSGPLLRRQVLNWHAEDRRTL